VDQTCAAPPLPTSAPATLSERTALVTSPPVATPNAESAAAPRADRLTADRIIAGIENFVACRNAGNYAAYAALLTPNRMLAEVGSTNPDDVMADLRSFNLPITILSLGDVRREPEGRLSADFVHLFGPHLYYRSRLYVVEQDGFVMFDEERFLPEEPPGEQTAVDIQLANFAIELSRNTLANAPYVVLRGRNVGTYPHEIVAVRLPPGVTVEAALAGEVPEEKIEFIGQATIEPGESDDLVLVNLEPGTYTLLCLLDVPDGIPHAAKGMVTQITVEGTAAI
jgi:uncharacterized cupredoxin-like copper-binding protein